MRIAYKVLKCKELAVFYVRVQTFQSHMAIIPSLIDKGEREALAAMFFVEYWEKYLLGKNFVLRSDHQTLRTLLTQFGNGRKSGKFQRWYERLQVFDYHLGVSPWQAK